MNEAVRQWWREQLARLGIRQDDVAAITDQNKTNLSSKVNGTKPGKSGKLGPRELWPLALIETKGDVEAAKVVVDRLIREHARLASR